MTQLHQHLHEIFSPAKRAIEEGRIPGAALGLITKDRTREVAVFGKAQIEPHSITL